jgi:hypothetical protein
MIHIHNNVSVGLTILCGIFPTFSLKYSKKYLSVSQNIVMDLNNVMSNTNIKVDS